MADLYGEMTDKKFDKLATTAIANWWNGQEELVAKFGQISPDEIYTTWKCKAIENFKGLFWCSSRWGWLIFRVYIPC